MSRLIEKYGNAYSFKSEKASEIADKLGHIEDIIGDRDISLEDFQALLDFAEFIINDCDALRLYKRKRYFPRNGEDFDYTATFRGWTTVGSNPEDEEDVEVEFDFEIKRKEYEMLDKVNDIVGGSANAKYSS